MRVDDPGRKTIDEIEALFKVAGAADDPIRARTAVIGGPIGVREATAQLSPLEAQDLWAALMMRGAVLGGDPA